MTPVSIIISSHNRSQSLRETPVAIAALDARVAYCSQIAFLKHDLTERRRSHHYPQRDTAAIHQPFPSYSLNDAPQESSISLLNRT